jgi:drug/metabolite transporter (DMT)-like permease
VSFFGWSKLSTKKPFGHLIRAFSSVACVVLFFFGIKFLLLSENQAIFHSSPIIATLLAVPILGEKIGMNRLLAVILGFIGVLIILKPGTSFFNLYSLIPLASAFFMAGSYLATRYLMSTESSVAIVFYYSFALLFTSLLFFPNNFIMPNLIDCIPLFALGIMGSLGHFFLSLAAKNAEVMVIAPFEYSSFIFVSFLGYLFFNEVPGMTVYVGMLLIIISGIYIIYREQKNLRKN